VSYEDLLSKEGFVRVFSQKGLTSDEIETEWKTAILYFDVAVLDACFQELSYKEQSDLLAGVRLNDPELLTAKQEDLRNLMIRVKDYLVGNKDKISDTKLSDILGKCVKMAKESFMSDFERRKK